jgi:hypothetical protein
MVASGEHPCRTSPLISPAKDARPPKVQEDQWALGLGPQEIFQSAPAQPLFQGFRTGTWQMGGPPTSRAADRGSASLQFGCGRARRSQSLTTHPQQAASSKAAGDETQFSPSHRQNGRTDAGLAQVRGTVSLSTASGLEGSACWCECDSESWDVYCRPDGRETRRDVTRWCSPVLGRTRDSYRPLAGEIFSLDQGTISCQAPDSLRAQG